VQFQRVPPPAFYLFINGDGRLEARRADGWSRVVESPSDLRGLVGNRGDGDIVYSSSLDAPEEFTTDPTVIAMCDALRGGPETAIAAKCGDEALRTMAALTELLRSHGSPDWLVEQLADKAAVQASAAWRAALKTPAGRRLTEETP
jgi:hypothetical protein